MCFKVVSKYFQTYSHIDLQTPTTVEWEQLLSDKIPENDRIYSPTNLVTLKMVDAHT